MSSPAPQLTIAPELSECLLRIVESAAQVRRRYQYFLWTQADIQRLLPHKLAICGVYDRSRRDLVFEALHSLPLPAEALTVLSDARGVLMQRLAMAWIEARQQPTWVDLEAWSRVDRGAQSVCEAGYARLLIHGVSRPGRPADLETLFIFGSPDPAVSEELPASQAALSMLLPYLHSTYVRVHSIESDMNGGGTAAPTATRGSGRYGQAGITEREREILRWVREGMSNQQIADALNISALTVKNHVQKILRKLGAANRAQALAKAMAMNLLVSGVQDVPKH